MEGSTNRKILVAQYQTLVGLLKDRSVEFDVLSQEELGKMSDPDLAKVIRVLRDLSRTPVS